MSPRFANFFDTVKLKLKQRYAVSYPLDFGRSLFQDFFEQIDSIDISTLNEIYFETRHPTIKFYIIDEVAKRLEISNDLSLLTIYFDFIINFLQTQVKYAVPHQLFGSIIKFFPQMDTNQQLLLLEQIPTKKEKYLCVDTLSPNSYITLKLLGGGNVPKIERT